MLRQKHEISKTNKIFFIYLSRENPHSSSPVSVGSLLFNSIDPLANYFSVFVLPGEVPWCIPSKISYPFFSIRKSEDFLFFCCRILNFLSIFLIFCCILRSWASFSIASRVNKTTPLFFLKILLSIAKTFLYFCGRSCPKIHDTCMPTWAYREKVKRRRGE